MNELNSKLVGEVTYYLQGARRVKFQASVNVINASLAQGGWIPRGSVKANAGFYQGLYRKGLRHPNHEIDMCLTYGRAISKARLAEFEDKLTSIERTWVLLCREVAVAAQQLNDARPLPKITKIGLSPKVTKTLTECNLDLDLATIKLAKIKSYEIPALDKEGKPTLNRDGEPLMEKVYYVAWTPGILFGKSRFAYHDCEACGKRIPSGRFVPVEATCKKLGLVGLWVGCDCAANIFGIKDVGITKAAPPA